MRTERGAGTGNRAETVELQAHHFCKKVAKSREIYNFTAFCGGPNRDRTDDLTDANEPTGIVCTWIWPFLAVSANNHFVFKPLVTTIFRVFREPLWYVLWSASEPRWNAPARDRKSVV